MLVTLWGNIRSYFETIYNTSPSSSPPKEKETKIHQDSISPCRCIYTPIQTCFHRIWSFFSRIFSWIFSYFQTDHILNETKKILSERAYIKNGLLCQLSPLESCADQTKIYDFKEMGKCLPFYISTTLINTKEDFLEAIAPEDLRNALIYDQKEIETDLCRRTGLSYILEKIKNLSSSSESAVVCFPSVPTFRFGKAKDFSFAEKPKNITLIASLPKKTEQRIWNEFFTAYENNCANVLVVTKGDVFPYLYVNILQKYFTGAFKKITFVILDASNHILYEHALKQYNKQLTSSR